MLERAARQRPPVKVLDGLADVHDELLRRHGREPERLVCVRVVVHWRSQYCLTAAFPTSLSSPSGQSTSSLTRSSSALTSRRLNAA